MRFSFFEPSGWLTADRKRRPPTKFTIVHNIYCMWSAIKPHHHWWSTKRNLFITENFCILIQKNIEIKSDTQPYNFISIPCPGIVQSAVWKCRVHSAQRNVNYAITNLIITNWMSNKYSISSSYFFFFESFVVLPKQNKNHIQQQHIHCFIMCSFISAICQACRHNINRICYCRSVVSFSLLFLSCVCDALAHVFEPIKNEWNARKSQSRYLQQDNVNVKCMRCAYIYIYTARHRKIYAAYSMRNFTRYFPTRIMHTKTTGHQQTCVVNAVYAVAKVSGNIIVRT